jgi:alkylation response protein AidB-like acyl-CoA dehydrogenase
MKTEIKREVALLENIINEDLKPYVKRIDAEAYYAENYLRKLGEAGFLSSENKSKKDTIMDEMYLVKETAKVCMTTAFCLWCHLAALTYVRNTKNEKLKNELLPALESGEILGGTGLSNPMKFYAGLENLHLSAKKVEGGYLVSGVLPSVSNLGKGHSFGFVAGLDDTEQIMGIVSCDVEGLQLKEKVDYLAINGSATYACSFKDVFIPNENILSEDAGAFIEVIRPAFLLYQIPLGLGVTQASIESIEKVCQRQNGCNQYLKNRPEDLRQEEEKIQAKIQTLFDQERVSFKEIAAIRLQSAYLTLEAVQASMLHNGSAGYLQNCAPSRRLREAYFFANLTPTIKHLEKVLNG